MDTGASIVQVFVQHASSHVESLHDQLYRNHTFLRSKLRQKKRLVARRVYACGKNDYNELGILNRSEVDVFTLVESLSDLNVIQMAAGADFSLALCENGDIYAAGNNEKGQLGQGDIAPKVGFQLIKALCGKGIVQISATNMCQHALARAANGRIYTWGANQHGILGLGYTSAYVSTPTEIMTLRDKNIISVSASGYTEDSSSFAISANGDLWAWGYDSYSNLLPHEFTAQYVPFLYPGLKNIVYAASGGYHGVVMNDRNQVYVFGYNNDGRLGLGFKGEVNKPTLQDQLIGKGIVEIISGGCFVYARTKDNEFYAWGDNASGAICIGNNNDQVDVVHVPAVSNCNITRIRTGYRHCYGISDIDGKIYSWGKGSTGQLGSSSSVYDALKPTYIDLQGVFDIAAGGECGFALCQ